MAQQLVVVFLLSSLFSYVALNIEEIQVPSTTDFNGEDFNSINFSYRNYTLINNKNQVEQYQYSEALRELLSKLEASKYRIDRYYNNADLRELLRNMEAKHSSYMQVIWIGDTSVAGEPIYGVHLSHDARKDRKLLKPMFKYVANIQGDDAVGYAMLVSLIQYLVFNYNNKDNPRIKRMMSNIDIWIIPRVNVWGLMQSEEGQCASGYSLNREGIYLDGNFPDQFRTKRRPSEDLAKETKYMMKFIKNNPFVLSGNVQGGAIVASYPYDNACRRRAVPIITPDIAIFERMAKNYARLNKMMAPGTACNNSFPGGITNGYLWRKKKGGMQDYNYVHSNCFELTFYLSCCKYPAAEFLPFYWEANLEPMLRFIESTRRGVYGLVKGYKDGLAFHNAIISVEGFDKTIRTTPNGEYWRLLTPGSDYNVTAKVNSCVMTKNVRVDSTEPYVRLDFILIEKGIYGQVRDTKGNALVNATVTADTREAENVTLKGEYCIRLIPNLGYNYVVTATAPGYNNSTEEIELTYDKDSVTIDFVLTSYEEVNGQE